MSELDPSAIMQIGMGFFASKTLLSAVELGLFTELAKQPMTAAELGQRLGLHPRAVPDFPDALVALKLLQRQGDGPNGTYRNTPEGAAFLDRNSPNYIGGILEMANARLYRFWSDLTEALKTGAPQNEIKGSGASMFAKLYEETERLEQFMNAMSGSRVCAEVRFHQVQDAVRYRRSNRTTVLHGRGGKSSYAMYDLRPAQGRAHCKTKD
jgi:Dimerisation domain